MSNRNEKTSDFEGKPAVIVKQSQVNSVKNMSVQNNAPRASQNYLNNDLQFGNFLSVSQVLAPASPFGIKGHQQHNSEAVNASASPFMQQLQSDSKGPLRNEDGVRVSRLNKLDDKPRISSLKQPTNMIKSNDSD